MAVEVEEEVVEEEVWAESPSQFSLVDFLLGTISRLTSTPSRRLDSTVLDTSFWEEEEEEEEEEERKKN